MPSEEWMQLESMFQKVCGIISVITNAFLMFLILTKSPPKLGTYKWLMLYTALFETFYSCISFFVDPIIHTHESLIIAFQDLKQVWIDRKTTEYLIVIYCSFFGSSMAFFAAHFIYRYGTVNLDFKQKYLSGSKQLLFYICPIACGVFWGINVWIFMLESKMKSDFVREHIDHKFHLNIDDCVYVGMYFWPKDKNGNVYPDPMAFIGNGIMWIILGSSSISVLYFATKCYRYISQKLGSIATQSQASKALQSQLFYALIVQSAIPCFLMYLPAGSIFTCPMSNIDPELKYPFVAITIAIYPAIDPLPTILIIKSYRRACIDLIKCRRKNQISVDYSNNVPNLSS